VPPPWIPRALTPRQVRWLLNVFPPWLVQGVRVVELEDDFRRCLVRVRKSRLTGNLQGMTFGGTIFAAADPMHAILYWQILAHRGVRAQAWLRSATIRYLKPVRTALTLEFTISEEEIAGAIQALAREGRHSCAHVIEVRDTTGDVCARAETEVYLRVPPEDQKELSAF